VRIITLPGVFAPRSDSWMLANLLAAQTLPAGAPVLDVCTGSGAVAVVAARRGAEVTAVDLSRRAVLSARLNARLNGVEIRAVRGDLFGAVGGARFDAIVSNPPYLPGEDDELPGRGAARAWEGGRDGRLLLDRLCAEAAAHLRPGGILLLVHSSVCGEEETLARLREGGLEPDVVARRRGPLGPLLAPRAEALEARGLLARGRREEDVIVFRGRSTAGEGQDATAAPSSAAAPG